MITFLFWNMGANNWGDTAVRLVKDNGVDVLILAEFRQGAAAAVDLLSKLNCEASDFHYNPGECKKVVIFSKFQSRLFRPIFETNRLTIRRLNPSTSCDLLLVATHLPSKLHYTDADQALAATDIAKDIEATEKQIGHARTMLVGDLNMSPFEHGLVASTCLHATMDRRIAERGDRTVNGRSCRFFYNPMWNLLGDASPGPPGTYYRSESKPVAYFWHMFDQILIRPALLPMFRNEDLQIVDTVGADSLVGKRGIPDPRFCPDHLPLIFRLHC